MIRSRLSGLWISVSLAVALVGFRNPGVWKYLSTHPSAFNGDSFAWILGHALVPIIFAFFLSLTAWATGLAILGSLVPIESAGTFKHVFAFALGLGALALGVFLLGLAGATHKAPLASLILLAAAMSAIFSPYHRRIPSMSDEYVSNQPGTQSSGQRPMGPATGRTLGEERWRWILWGLLLYAGWHALILSLAPPTEWDVLAYHLALPKLYVDWGGIREIPWMLHSHWPNLMEVLYCLPLSWGQDTAAALIHVAACGALAGAVLLVGRSWFDERCGLAAAALLTVQPAFTRVAPTAHSDGALALFYFLSCAALWIWRETEIRNWLVVAGLLGGFAASSKLLGAIPFACLALWVALQGSTDRRKTARLIPSGLYLLSGLALLLPWYVKSWAWAGNPVWPFLPGIFGGNWGGPQLVSSYLSANAWHHAAMAEWIRNGPQFLLIPAAAFAAGFAALRIPGPKLLRLLLFPLPFYLVAVARNQEAWRFLIIFFPALCLGIAWACEKLIRLGGKWLIPAAMAFGIGFWPAAGLTQNNQLFSVLGLHSAAEPDKNPRELYLERSLDHYRFFQAAGRLCASQGRTLFFREIRGYYWNCDYQWGDPVNQGLIRYDALPDPEALHGRLKELGIRFILVNKEIGMYRPSPGYYTSKTIALMDETLRRYTLPLMDFNGLTLYRLTH